MKTLHDALTESFEILFYKKKIKTKEKITG